MVIFMKLTFEQKVMRKRRSKKIINDAYIKSHGELPKQKSNKRTEYCSYGRFSK